MLTAVRMRVAMMVPMRPPVSKAGDSQSAILRMRALMRSVEAPTVAALRGTERTMNSGRTSALSTAMTSEPPSRAATSLSPWSVDLHTGQDAGGHAEGGGLDKPDDGEAQDEPAGAFQRVPPTVILVSCSRRTAGPAAHLLRARDRAARARRRPRADRPGPAPSRRPSRAALATAARCAVDEPRRDPHLAPAPRPLRPAVAAAARSRDARRRAQGRRPAARATRFHRRARALAG